MAFLGDFGKTFLGGASTGEAAATTAAFFGASPSTQEGIAKASQGFSEFVSGGNDNDTTPSPAAAGIDSPATLRPASQTSQYGFGGSPYMQPVSQQAGLGFAVPAITRGLQNITRSMRNVSPGAAFGAGSLVGAAGEFFVDAMGTPRKLIITRKMQREVKEIFMFTGGDIVATMEIYSNFKQRRYDTQNILSIMLKKFSNQGPYVTKAAVRKTRQTIRKMKTLCDMHDDLTPKRRAPVRRRATTTTKLVRNG